MWLLKRTNGKESWSLTMSVAAFVIGSAVFVGGALNLPYVRHISGTDLALYMGAVFALHWGKSRKLET